MNRYTDPGQSARVVMYMLLAIAVPFLCGVVAALVWR
jgi:hypothetical protein